MIPEMIIRRSKVNDRNAFTGAKKDKAPTEKQVNTSKIVHEQLSHYDELIRMYNMDSSFENKTKLQEYSQRIRSQYQLALLTQEYIYAHPEVNALTHISKIRALIKKEADQQHIIKIEGVLRNPKTTPFENITGSGNVITIIMPPPKIDSFIGILVVALADFPVNIITPCNNMIMIIEIGEVTEIITPELHKLVRQKLMTFSLQHNMESYPVAETTKYYIK